MLFPVNAPVCSLLHLVQMVWCQSLELFLLHGAREHVHLNLNCLGRKRTAEQSDIKWQGKCNNIHWARTYMFVILLSSRLHTSNLQVILSSVLCIARLDAFGIWVVTCNDFQTATFGPEFWNCQQIQGTLPIPLSLRHLCIALYAKRGTQIFWIW